MKIKVIYEYRGLLLPHNNMGTMLENGATTLDFEIPKELADYTNRSLVVTNSVGSHVLPLTNNQVELTKKETGESSAEIQLVLTDFNDNEWCSQPYVINFYRRIDDSGKNVFDGLKKQWIAEAQRPLSILVNRVTEKVTELLNERRNKS